MQKEEIVDPLKQVNLEMKLQPQSDEDEVLQKLKANALGYARLKEIQSIDIPAIFGLGDNQRTADLEHFEVLCGEKQLFDSPASCEHNFDYSQLKGKYDANMSAEQKKRLKSFITQQGMLVITNYRVLFVAKSGADSSYDEVMAN